jgi:hypothetical protein
MKKIIKSSPLIITMVLSLTHYVSLAQENNEAEIRKLENMEGEAWIKKDTATLLKLFSPQLIVNTPYNRIADLNGVMALARMGKIDASFVEKGIEKISFVENIAIVMGHDIIKPQGAMENAGKTVTRRYTDIWMKDIASWRLVARQATNISIQ